MTRALAALVLVASLPLAACAPAPTLPAGLTRAEVAARQAQDALGWWNSFAPGEPMPVIDPVKFIDPEREQSIRTDCVVDANLPGVAVDEDGGVLFNNNDADVAEAFQRVQFICAQRYPYDITHPESIGMFSDEQIAYLADYATTRLIPCLRLHGYDVPDHPDGQIFLAYYEVFPTPRNQADWDVMDARCPPAPWSGVFRPRF